MFGAPAGAGGTVLAEFKAGKCEWVGRRMITPDKRKGQAKLLNGDDGLMHFQWYDREKTPMQLEDDLIVINDAYLEKIQAPATAVRADRVYILRFTSSDKKAFFWMQEPKEEKDVAVVEQVNTSIGATIPPKPAGGATPAAAAPSAAAPGDPNDLMTIMRNFQAAQQAQGASPQNTAMQNQLASILGNFVQNQANRPPAVPLAQVLPPELLQSLMEDPEAVAELMQHMPESQRTNEDLRETLGSPQLRGQMSGLTQAIHSDQLSVLFAMLGLDATALTPGVQPMEALCNGMEKKYGEGDPPPKEEKKDEEKKDEEKKEGS